MKDRCETCEMSISALLDGEAAQEEILPALDHLLECSSCRDFYRDARALGTALQGAAVSRMPEAAPEALWERIDQASFETSPVRERWRSWAPRLAAAVLLALGTAWAALSVGGMDFHSAGQPIEVVLGESESMTEQRFVQITAEILRSDRRYHQEMLRVMSAVAEETGAREAPADQSLPFSPETDDEKDREQNGGRR